MLNIYLVTRGIGRRYIKYDIIIVCLPNGGTLTYSLEGGIKW